MIRLHARFTSQLMLAATVVCWLSAAALGIAKLWSYANTPGQAGEVPASWPSASHLSRQAGLPTLVMLVHPQCACSDASLAELERLMARVYGRVTAHVLFLRPTGVEPEWLDTPTWKFARSIPGVEARLDDEGREAGRFGAFVSGQTLLFDADGRLTFAGGLTFARGHRGDNEGRTAVQALVLGQTAATHRTAVFGCALRSPRKDS